MRTSIFLVVFFVLISCNNNDRDTKAAETEKTSQAKSDTIPLTKRTDAEILKFLKEIPLDEAATLIYHHRKNRLDRFGTTLGKQDSRFVDYNISELADYLQYAINNLGADGVRVYFGVHSPALTTDKKNSQTVLFIPTKGKRDIVENGNVLMYAFDEGQLCPPPYPCSSAGAILMNTADDGVFKPKN